MKSANSPQRIVLSLSIIIVTTLTFAGAKLWRARGQSNNTVTTVSAASYLSGLAPEAIAAAFGTRLATQTKLAVGLPLPTDLAGTTVRVNGVPAPLFFVSSGQVNFLIPPGTATGNPPVVITSGDGTVSTGIVQVGAVAPAIFTANAAGAGLPAAVALRVAGGAQDFEPINRPLNLGPASDRLFLILYVCGVRRAAAGTVNVIIGNDEIPAAFAGPTSNFVGLDQINVELPRYLSGRGRVPLQVRAGDLVSNNTEIEFGGADPRLATATSIASSANPTVVGQPINFTVQVTAANQSQGAPTGNAILLENGAMIGNKPLGAAGQAVFSYAFAAAGARTITASYDGRTYFKGSAGGLNTPQAVNKASTTITITSSSNPANRDQAITLTAEVKANPTGTITPSGVVQFKENGAALGAPVTLINGRASLTTSTLALGTRTITADYYGEPGFQLSVSASFTQAIAPRVLVVGGIGRSSPTYASDEITINGSGFTTNPADHEVKVVADDGKETTALVVSATADQLRVRVPFGAGSGKVTVRVLGGPENESPARLELGTSVSGFVQEFRNGARAPVTGLPIALREPGGRRIETLTNIDGSFVLKGAVSSPLSLIEIAGRTTDGLNYPAQSRKLGVISNRDNQYKGDGDSANIIELKPNSSNSTGALLAETQINESLSAAAPANPEEIADTITSGQVTFDTNNSTITFPGGGTSGNLGLTVLDPGRTPSNLPALPSGSYFSSTIAQITPFGATLSPGGKLSFPNSDGIPAGTPVRVFRFDQVNNSQTLGQFIDIGAATISADGSKIETAANAVTQTSYYFVSRQWPMATIIGIVSDADGRAVRRAVVSARGQSVFTGNNGGFVLANVPVITPDGANDQVTIEISFVRPDGSVARTQRTITGVKANDSIQLSQGFTLPRADVNRQPYLIAPASLVINEGETKEFNFIASDPDGRQLIVTVSGASFASVIAQGNSAYRLRLAPGANTANNYTLLVQASDNPGNGPSLTATQSVAVTVQKSNNNRPTANYQSVTTNEDTALGITLSANNPGGGSLSYTILGAPARGVLSGPAPNLLYTPALNYNGLDSFIFKVSNNNGESNVATVFIGINPVNDAPVLTISSPSSLSLNAGETLKIDVSATDVDAGQTLSFSATGLPPGAALIPATGGAQFIWTPIFKQIGSYQVGLAVKDDVTLPSTQTRQFAITVEAKWAKTSGPEGGSIVALAINGPNIFAGTYGGSLFLSTDEGRSWSSRRDGIPDDGFVVYSVAFSGPFVFAATQTAGVYRSSDNGRKWVPVNNGIRYPDGSFPYFSVIFAKGNSLFAGSAFEGVYRSTNNGESWTQIVNGLQTANCSPPHLLTFAAKGNILFLGTSKGMFRSLDDGNSWSQINNGLPPYPNNCGLAYVNALFVKDNKIFAGTDGGLYVSSNDGQTWVKASNDLPDSSFGQTIERAQTLFSGGLLGLYKSTNDGINWQKSENGLPKFFGDAALPIGNLGFTDQNLFTGTGAGMYRSANNGMQWSEADAGLIAQSVTEVLAANNQLFASTIDSGIFRSGNGGKSWSKANNGLINFDIHALAANGSQLFAGGRFGLAYRSTDSGLTWTEVSAGLPDGRVEALTVSENNIYAGVADNSFFEFNEGLFGGGIYRFNNSGNSWVSINSNLPRNPSGQAPNVNSVAASSPFLFIGTQGHGVFRSNNNGAGWTAINSGLPRFSNGDYPSVDSILASGSTLLIGTSHGLFRSTDSGSSWVRILNQNYINTVAREGKTLFAGAGIVFSNPRYNVGGVFMSRDNGDTWIEINSALTNRTVSSFAFQDGNLFAGTGGSGVFIFSNTVQSWSERNTQLTNKFVNCALTTATSIVIGSLGGGVFRSTDLGQSWQPARSGLPQNANVQALAGSGASLFAGLLGNGVYRSSNDGTSWRLSGLANQTINALKVNHNGLIFAATDAGVFRSPTNSDSWTNAGLSNLRVVSLALIGNRLLAGTYGGGVWASDGNGANWTQIGRSNNGLANLFVTALTIGADGATLFAGTDGGGIYRSTNGGTSWTAVNNDIPSNLNVYSFEVSGNKLYAGSIYGVFLSEDNGAKWKQLNAGLLDIYVTSLAVDGMTLIAATRVGGVFVSRIP